MIECFKYLHVSYLIRHEKQNFKNENENSENKQELTTMLGKKRRKFENTDDHLLMIGLLHHGKKYLD